MELLIVLGAIAVAVLILGWVFRLIRTTIQTVLLVGFLLLALYFLFGVGPAAIWGQIQTWLGVGQGR